MNYLAHLYLSGSDADIQVGGLLGDFVKGPLRGDRPPAIEYGIQLHRRIDSFTNRSPIYAELRPLFPTPWRRFADIVIDIGCDHLLARRWSEFHHQPLERFCNSFYGHLHLRRHILPPGGARHFLERAHKVRWLEGYADVDRIPRVLDHIGSRLRKPLPLGKTWSVIENNRGEFVPAFYRLMAQLQPLAEDFLANCPAPGYAKVAHCAFLAKQA